MINIIQKFKNLFKKKDNTEEYMKQLDQENKKAERLAALHSKARKQLKKNKKQYIL